MMSCDGGVAVCGRVLGTVPVLYYDVIVTINTPLQLGCDGGVAVCGRVLGTVPVLCSMDNNNCNCLVSICGNLVITRGRDLVGVVQSLQGVTQVRLA